MPALDPTTVAVSSAPSPDGQYFATFAPPVTLTPNARQIFVGTGGTLVVKTLGGTLLTFKNVMSGSVIAGWVFASIETGTTATDLVIGY